MALSWKPERNGDKYCSPACGRGCTIDEWIEAVNEADWLVAGLNSVWHNGKWTAEVHENCGWYSLAKSPCGRINVWIDRICNTYTAYLNHPGAHVGIYAKSGKSAEEAVANVINAGREALARAVKLVEGLPEVVSTLGLYKEEPGSGTFSCGYGGR